jgi:outer membrane protein, heavy metal efflux system
MVRSDRAPVWAAPWLAGLLLTGTACVSRSIRGDVAKVAELAHVEALPPLPDGRVDTRLADDAQKLLTQPLDADAAVRVALLNNRALRARLRELGVERGLLLQAGTLANPLIEAELSPERNTRVELRVEYDVMSFVLAPLKARAAAHELEAARYAAAGDVVALGYEVRAAFYTLAAAEQSFDVATISLGALAAGSEAAKALVAAGNLRELDASTQIAAYERARIAVAKLELRMAEAREQLTRLLGLHGHQTRMRVVPELPPAPDELPRYDDAEVRALKANLELAAVRERLEAIARRTGIARTEGFLPHLDVDLHGLVGDPETGNERVRLGGGVSLAVPVFDRKQGVVRAREAEFDAWLERYQGLAIDVRSSAREALARLASTQLRAQRYQSVIVPAQRNVMVQTLLQYNAMQVGVFQLLEARRAELEVALDQAETLREFWVARAALDALLAGKLVGVRTAAAPAEMGARTAASAGGH